MDLAQELEGVHLPAEEDPGAQTALVPQLLETGRGDPPRWSLRGQSRIQDELAEPSHAQRLLASRHGHTYSQSHRLLPGCAPLYMSVVTEGTPEDEQSSRNPSCLRASLDSTAIRFANVGGSFKLIGSEDGAGTGTPEEGQSLPVIELVAAVNLFSTAPRPSGTKLTQANTNAPDHSNGGLQRSSFCSSRSDEGGGETGPVEEVVQPSSPHDYLTKPTLTQPDLDPAKAATPFFPLPKP